MDPALTDDELLLRDAARDLLAAGCPVELLRAHRDDVTAAVPLWDRLRDFVPLGLGPLTELCVLTEELGYVAAPTPFFATACLYAPLLDATGEHDLDPVLDGHATGTVAFADDDGRAVDVLDAPTVDLVAAVDPAGTVTLLAAAPAERIPTVDSTRCLYVVDTNGTGLAAGTVTATDLVVLLDRARVALAAELTGTARGLLDATGADSPARAGLDRARTLVRRAALAADHGTADRHELAVTARAAAATVALATAGTADPTDAESPAGFLARRARGAAALLPIPA